MLLLFWACSIGNLLLFIWMLFICKRCSNPWGLPSKHVKMLNRYHAFLEVLSPASKAVFWTYIFICMIQGQPQGLYEGHRNKSQLALNSIIKLRNAYQRSKTVFISRFKYKIHLVDILCVFRITVFCKVNVKSCIDKPDSPYVYWTLEKA